jgi:hypothetical protein
MRIPIFSMAFENSFGEQVPTLGHLTSLTIIVQIKILESLHEDLFLTLGSSALLS